MASVSQSNSPFGAYIAGDVEVFWSSDAREESTDWFDDILREIVT